MRKKVCILTSVHPWNDVRIAYKQATSLAKKYDVVLHATASFKKKRVNNVQIHGVKWRPFRWRWITSAIFFMRCICTNADVFHIHDPELIPLGVIIKFLKRKPVIYDMHEDNYTSMLNKSYSKISARLLRAIEQRTMRIFDYVIFAEKYYKELFDLNNIVYEDILNYPLPAQCKKKPHKKINLIYTGSVTKLRGIYNMLHFFKYLNHDKYHLFIVGHVQEEKIRDILKKYKQSPLGKHFTIIGIDAYVDRSMINAYYTLADVGLAIFDRNPHYEKKILTKFYEYLQNGLFIVASNFSTWKNFIEKNKCGMVINPPLKQAAKDFEKQFRKIKCSNKYSWKSEENKLLNIYEGVLHD